MMTVDQQNAHVINCMMLQLAAIPKLVSLLLDVWADINEANEQGDTVLLLASQSGFPKKPFSPLMSTHSCTTLSLTPSSSAGT
jgi:hypothetical protein